VFTRKKSFSIIPKQLIKPSNQKKSEAGWTVPANLTSSLNDIQGYGERQIRGENRDTVDSVQRLIRVRSGQLFILVFALNIPLFSIWAATGSI
jgi:hypothetical protein